MKTYNGVPLDGRPMTILIATSEVQPAARPVVKKIQNNTRGSPRKMGGGKRIIKVNWKFVNYKINLIGGRRFGGGGARGGARGGGGGGGGARNKKPAVTIDDLNAELDAYTMQG